MALLRKGRTYRITFETTVLGVAFLVGSPLADSSATWTDLRVTIDKDQDRTDEILAALAEHDAAVRAELAEHDKVNRAWLLHLVRQIWRR